MRISRLVFCVRNERPLDNRYNASNKLVLPLPFGPKTKFSPRFGSMSADFRFLKSLILTLPTLMARQAN